jgi:quinoprotein dehydrogenase-associated probable ABC transporter substrate-binding protein
MSSACRSLPLLLAAASLLPGGTLRVCADPNSLPFSNQHGDGIENRLAQMVARDLGAQLEFVWWPQRGHLIKNTLAANRCDALMGVPSEMPGALTTSPWYRSTYVFVQRRSGGPPVTSLQDDRLASMRIGIHMVGEGYAPPAVVLGRRGLAERLKGYSLFGNGEEANPPARLIEAVAHGDVDIAIAWGPLAGYFSRHSDLELTPVSPSSYLGVPFTYSISAGVREGDTALRESLNAIFRRECSSIHSLLAEYAFPLEPSTEDTGCASALQSSASSR